MLRGTARRGRTRFMTALATDVVITSLSEKLRQDRGEHVRVHLMRLPLQRPQLALRDRLAQHPRRVGHERKARVARHHESGTETRMASSAGTDQGSPKMAAWS